MQAHELSSGRVESRQRPPVDRSQTVPAKILIPPEPVGGAWLRREVENAGRPVSFDSSNMGHMVDYRGNQDLDFRNTIPPRASQFTSFNTPGNAVMGSGMHGAAQSSAIRNERWHEHRSIGDDFRRMEQIEYLRHQQRQQSHLSSPQSPQSPHPSHPVQYFHESSQLLGAIQHTAPTVHAPAPVKAEDPHLKELVEELDQLFQMYCMHPVGKEVWDTLIQDADGLVDKVAEYPSLKSRLEKTRAQIEAYTSSHQFEMESRLQACELGLQQVQQQVEEGKLEDMSISQYDDMISKVGKLQVECDELKKMGVTSKRNPDCVNGEFLMQTLKGIKQSVSENALVLEEMAYAQRISDQFVVLSSPNDGDCLFHSIFMSMVALQALKQSRSALGKPTMSYSELMERVHSLYGPEAILNGTYENRLLAVQTMRSEAEVFKPVIVDILHCCLQPTQTDVTSQMMREELRRRYGTEFFSEEGELVEGANLSALFSKDDIVDVYCSVMGTPGVFGEKAEIYALSKALKKKVYLYYYHGERLDSKGSHLPAEVFNPKASGKEINLLHSVGGRHYSALIRKDLLKKETLKEISMDWELRLPNGCVGVGMGLKVAFYGDMAKAEAMKGGGGGGGGAGGGSFRKDVGGKEGQEKRYKCQVVEVYKGGGSAQQHIAKNDLLLSIDGQSTFGMKMSEVQSLLSGAPGSTVQLELERPKKGRYSCKVERVALPPSTWGKSLFSGVKDALSLSGRYQR